MEVYNEKILVADYEIEICRLLKVRLSFLGYKVFVASNGNEALVSFNANKPDLVIVSTILPKLDGYEVCRRIRESSDVPLILITPLDNISDRVAGLNLGADDYIVKPFSPHELEARVKSILRRFTIQAKVSPTKRQKIFQIDNLVIDMNTRLISKNNSKIKLTNIQYSLFELLIENAGHKLSRETILNNIWGYTPERYGDTRIVDVHISRLRSKIEEDPSNPDLIMTIRGMGYMFKKC